MTEYRFNSIGFIGGGRVTRFLLEGWSRVGALPDRIAVSDPDREVAAALERDFKGVFVCHNPEAALSDLLFLAVHPPVMKGVLEEIAGKVRSSAVVVSLAPRIRIVSIQSMLGADYVVRMIPNAPSAIGRGYNPVTFAGDLGPELRQALGTQFEPWGEFPEVPESTLEAYALLAAMGPTYMWFQWELLREMGREFGVAGADVDSALHRMIEGAADLFFSKQRSPQQVMSMVPVEPLECEKEGILEAYRRSLPSLFQKLTS